MSDREIMLETKITRLREAGETLILVLGLTAFKYEEQRKILQEAVDGMVKELKATGEKK